MSSSESGSDVSSSSSEGSDNERSTNRDLAVIPSPVELSDSEDDGVSPSQSQHRLATMKQMVKHDVEPNSTSGNDEEEEEVEEEDVKQSIDGRSCTSFESKSSAAMFSKITEMSRQLAEMMEMHREQQL